MTASTPAQTPVDDSSWLGLALWRLSAGILYALALLLVPRHLPAAVFMLLAALLCLPGSRSAFLRGTGLRVGAGFSALGAMALVLGAVLSAGWPSRLPIPPVAASGGLVVAAAQSAKL